MTGTCWTNQVAAARYEYPAVREGHACELLRLGATRFAQVVAALLERPEAEAAYPVELRRLRRLRDARRRQRGTRVA